MKKGSMVGILVLIVLLVIGFATISTNIMINGNANLSFNENYFNVIFTEATTDGTYTISEDKQEINYITKSLSNVGDKSVIEYKVKNDSYQYDANVLLDTILNDQNNDKYTITYEILDSENPYSLESKRTITAKVIVELTKSVSSPINISMKLKLNLTAIGRTTEGKDNYTVIYNGNGADSGSMADQLIEFDKRVRLLSNNYSRTNYTFAGWSTTPTGHVEYHNNQEVLNISDNTITLYAVWIETFTNFDYTGSAQVYNVKEDGIYKVEVWGAQGWSINGWIGGYGGYSVGNLSLKSGDNINIYVGQAGSGGYCNGVRYTSYPNGGLGYCGDRVSTAGSGGGSTHMTFTNKQIYEMTNNTYKTDLLIAAGGGGSATWTTGSQWYGHGGHGGGQSGTKNNGNNFTGGNPGTQTTFGTYGGNSNATNNGAFGKGSPSTSCGAGGGGGLYGGGASWGGGGGGGSGYIGNALLTNKTMYCYKCSASNAVDTKTVSTTCKNATATENCAKTGNGYARITYIG